MKRLIILSTILLTFFNCSVNEKPEFIGVENIKILDTTPEYLILTADALFVNPNSVGGELKTDAIKVFVNDVEVAFVTSEKFEVPSNKEFSMPLKANIPIESVFGDANLSGLIGSLLTKKMKLQYKGTINYKVLGNTETYNIDKTKDIKIE